MPEATEFTSSEAVCASNRYKMITITGMERGFYEAAEDGKIEAFKDKDEHIESIRTPNKNTILHVHLTGYSDKVSKKFVEEVMHMCPAFVEKPIVNAKGETILHIAARYGHSEIVEKIIGHAKALPQGHMDEVGAEKRLIRAVNDKKDTALHEAVRYHQTQIVELLTKEDPDHPYFGNRDGETPLYAAVERRYWDVVDQILKNSNSPNHNGPNGQTALHAAVLHGHKAIVQKLLERTSATKQVDENGWVPLHLAALHKGPNLAEVLLKYDRNAAYMRDIKGRTALHFAAHSRNEKTLKKIIEYCPDCSELVDEKGCNALHYTTGVPEFPSFYNYAAEVILEKASLSNMYNEKDDSGNTPLHHLARYAPTWDVRREDPLLKKNPRVDIMAFNENNQTVADVAYDHVLDHVDSRLLANKNHFLERLGRIGGRLGGRVMSKYVRKKKQERRHNSTVDKKETQGSAVDKKEKEDSAIDPAFLDGAIRMRSTISVVATLIATVTFAAAFTIPGGTIQEGAHQGTPVLKHEAAFKAFVITNTLSFVFSASAVLLQIFSSIAEKVEDLILIYGVSLAAALLFTMLGMGFMIVAFATGTYAVLGVSKGLGVVALLIALSFFFTFGFFCYKFYKEIKSAYESSSSKEERNSLLRPEFALFHPEAHINGENIQLSDSV